MKSEAVSRDELVSVCSRIAQKGLSVSVDGNVSCRLDEERILVTPSGVSKANLCPTELIIVDLNGNPLDKGLKPSVELKMHLLIYQKREDVKAVVHAHPKSAIALSLAGISLETPLLSEVVLSLGGIPTAPYATPTTEEVPNSILPYVIDHNAIILARHGAVTMGRTLEEAFYRMETVEHAAQVVCMAHTLGKVEPLSSKETERLLTIKRELGIK